MTAEAPTRRRIPPLPAALAATVVALQIGYPLSGGVARDRLTVAIVVLLALTCLVDAAINAGPHAALFLLLLTAVPGYAVEVLGVHTGVPFGDYAYGSSLGTRVHGVPPVIGLAWTMLAWPAAIAARRLVDGFAARVLVGGWALAAADLFLDPQMVDAHRWRWSHPSPHLPGVADVPLSNYAGWLAVSLVLSLAVQALLVRLPDADDRLPIWLYLWLYVGWVMSMTVFLHLPTAAGWGALGMGAVAVPLALRLRRSR